MYDLQSYGRKIVEYTTKATGIPVSMGIAPTKTLAKVANKFAKKYPGYKGVCIIDTEEKRIRALQLTEIGDVWGVGRRYAKKLNGYGIYTAYDFCNSPSSWVRKQMTVVGERTWKELQGVSCIDLEQVQPDKKQICTSRAFGKPQTEVEVIAEAVASYATICAEKLREQNSCAVSLLVFIHTNNFRPELPQYFQNCLMKLPVASDSTFEIVKYALDGLRKIYKKGYAYKKAGVIITEIVPKEGVQGNLFVNNINRDKHEKVMRVMDQLNKGFNRNKISLAIAGVVKSWKLKREYLSPAYTTNIKDIIKVK